MRVVVTGLALAGMIAAILWAILPYRAAVAFHDAAGCAAGRTSAPGDGCVGRESARVTALSTDAQCGYGGCTTIHEFTVQRPHAPGGARVEVLQVTADQHRATERGDSAVLRTWHGDVVGVTLQGESTTYRLYSPGWLTSRLLVAWLALGLALWAALSSRRATMVRSCCDVLSLTCPVMLTVWLLLGGLGALWLLIIVPTAVWGVWAIWVARQDDHSRD